MPKAKFLKPEKPIRFDEAMRVSPQPKKSKLKKSLAQEAGLNPNLRMLGAPM
jgi:hypothetical protein